MGIKKLFDSNKPQAVLKSTNLEEEIIKNAPELESADNVREQIERINRFIPQADFGDPNSFVVYGSAQSYYEDAISRIYNQFPYDGSEEEITEFHNESSYLDLYIFDKKYPRTTGYIKIGTGQTFPSPPATNSELLSWGVVNSGEEYIKIVGGPHTASGGMPTGKLHTTFTGSNIYDTDIYGTDGTLALDRAGTRESNLRFDLSKGVTTEFWLKKEGFSVADTCKEVILDLWNGAASSSAGYGRFLLYITASGHADAGQNPLRLHLASGSNVADINLLSSTYTTASIGDSAWHHYAVSVESGSAAITTKAYVDGTLDNTTTSTINFGQVTGSLIAYIGALQTSPSGNTFHGSLVASKAGDAPLSASMDEFRYWKSKRDEKDIQHNWWTQVRGGTNNEIANAELGVYYKFNEGITGTDSTDSTVLDYSGRISNGNWVGYPGSTARNVGSAIDSSTAVVTGTAEYKDPIIYSSHPDVISHYNTYSATGSMYDNSNQSSILDSIPSWIVDDDELEGSNELKKLTQIIGSYADTLNLQVKALPTLADTTYLSSSYKPAPFTRNLLSSRGLAVPEIFVDADLLERFANRRSDRKYDMDINEVKNLIYQNIYNNLIYMYKSKGTEKAFRNLIRCYGIGDEVIKFNAYGNNTTFKFENTGYSTTTRKNYVDFNSTDRFSGTVYQSSSVTNTETNSITYVSGTSQYLANTAEIEVIFPRKFDFANPAYFHTPFLSSSIFGCHEAKDAPSDFDWKSAANDNSFQVYVVRTDTNSKDGYFLLKTRAGAPTAFSLTSSVYSNIYDNQKWNFAVRVKNKFWPTGPGISGSSGAANVKLEWYGANVEHGVVRNEFSLTASSLANGYLTAHRRYYVGADRTDTSGAIVTESDIRASSLRHWATYLNDEVIKHHAKDPDNVGALHPSRNMYFTADATGVGVDNQTIPEMASLALHWDFSQVTGSDAAGAFTVEDASSGSVSLQGRYSNDGDVSHIIANQYAGVAYFPGATSTTSVISKEYIAATKQRLPEVVSTDDAVNVLSRDDELFPRDAAVSQTFFAFEKSMYGVISQEMINSFGTILEFNNLIGEITHKYRGEYKGLRLLKQLFFEKIQNTPDLDKFIDYYKWIDSSLIIFLQQLVPASANVSEEIRVVVEDHILGRNKYRHQYPFLDYKGNARFGADEAVLEARVKSINELTYNWKFGHAPLNSLETTSAQWWKERASRSNTNFTTATLIDSARQSLNDIILSFNSASAQEFNTGAGVTGVYKGSTYALRRFVTPLKMTVDFPTQVGGGYNYSRGQKPDALFSIIKRGSTAARYDASKGSFKDIDIAESGPPIIQTKRKFDAQLGTENSDSTSFITSKLGLPAVVYSSSAGTTGYRSSTSGLEYAGLHNDSYGDDYDVPMQGPFPQEHVGGHRHRHINPTVDPSLTSSANRPEAWSLASGIFRSNDYNFTRPSTSPQYRRDQIAKRPFNIKNIQHTTASVKMGNFNKRYEVVQTSDRRTNNSEFVKSEGFSTASVTTDLLGYVGGLVDYAKPTRTRREHVIVERFSAPGGPEVAGDTIGGPGLDYESGQYSPYNNLNYRNTTVRYPLQTLLTERSERFGLRSGSAVSSANYTSVTASFHKINRNPLKRIEYSNQYVGDLGTVTTADTFDNYYVQHMIPRSDYQYAWITASYLSSNTDIYGYAPYDGFVSTSAGLIAALNFVSASDAGSVITSGVRRTKKDYANLGAKGWLPTDFVGMNTTIIEPISSSGFTIGYPLSTDIIHYYNYSDIGAAVTNTVNRESFIEKIGITAAATSTKASCLNSIINHRNGPYGYPTWKQIRVGHGQLARYYRKNNLYTHTPDVGEPIAVKITDGVMTTPVKHRTTLIVSQSVISSRHYPIVHELEIKVGSGAKKGRKRNKTKPVVVKSTFANNIITFDDNDFATEVIDHRRAQKSLQDNPYKQLLKMYSPRALHQPSNVINSINVLRYRETVYPSLKNSYTSKIRGRTNYENDFWRDDRTDRTTKAVTKKLTNSAGTVISQSAWALDASENFKTQIGPGDFSAGTGAANTSGQRHGELQNIYVHYHANTASQASPGVLYSRKHILPFTGSVTPAWGMEITEIIAAADANVLQDRSMATGEALWEAGTKAGKYEGNPSIFVVEPRTPFYDTYDSYFADIRSKGKGRSIIPEFRISDHLSFYQNSGDDFLTENAKFLTIVGTPTDSAIPQNSAEDNFFTIFTNSDFMKYFEVIKDDHKGIMKPSEIKLRCKAIKKFLPYDGFYPAERTVEISKQFITDYTASLQYVGGSETGEDAAKRVFLKPLMSPGILYNTIKSGLAVDYPILKALNSRNHKQYGPDSPLGAAQIEATFTASKGIFSNTSDASRLAADGVVDHSQGWDQRLPFETLLEPERYLAGVQIADDEPSAWARVKSVVAWDGEGGTEYKKMMNNFLAESVDFFLEGGRLSTINSLPQKDWLPVTPGTPYGMRVVMRRSMDKGRLFSGSWGNFGVPQNTRLFLDNGETDPYTGKTLTVSTAGEIFRRETFTMYSRPSAFGPPLGLHRSGSAYENPYQEVAGHNQLAGSIHDYSSQNGVYGSHTPPYYDGECWFDIIFWPRGLETSGSNTAGAVQTFRFKSDETGEQYKPTMDEIFAPVHEAIFTQSSSIDELNQTPLAGHIVRKWRYDQESLKNETNSSYHLTYHADTGTSVHIGPATGPFVNEWAMQLDASLNIFRKNKRGKKWSIQTKFETPMLNFNHVTSSDGTMTTSSNANYNSCIPRGMWHQFGRIPLKDEGVYIQVKDIPDHWLDSHPSATLKWDMAGVFSSQSKSPYVNTLADQTTYYNRYTVPIGSPDAYTYTKPKIQSLVDICGFNTDPVRVGEIRNKKKIFEAIVAAPFMEVEGERRFFKIPNSNTTTYNSVAGESIKRLGKMLKKYVFPPTFDFIQSNPEHGIIEVPAVAMYVFEFSHTLTKDDLSHIWQNLLPKIGVAPQVAMSTVSHPLLISELLGHDEEKLLSRQLKKKGTPTIGEFPERLQWMVFKVKQRAKRDYFTMIDGRTPIMPFYTYNWPYDYFSLVELAKIDAEVSFEMTARGKAYFTKHAGRAEEEGRAVPVDKGVDEVFDAAAADAAAAAAAAAESAAAGVHDTCPDEAPFNPSTGKCECLDPDTSIMYDPMFGFCRDIHKHGDWPGSD